MLLSYVSSKVHIIDDKRSTFFNLCTFHDRQYLDHFSLFCKNKNRSVPDMVILSWNYMATHPWLSCIFRMNYYIGIINLTSIMCEYGCCHALKTEKRLTCTLPYILPELMLERKVLWIINVIMHFKICIVTSKIFCIFSRQRMFIVIL